ncbi:integrase core domain-containing protein [Flavihumibacter sp. ZG627]|uniref:integrase core domain-containing protein n=1 Tax=Flavihumibacter sp. ZG627 TaxID=1463156 RepID=UPI00057E0937|nr:integrase core domain-containing protein [Flavihumibacter sp. ZG627]KIC91663.1 hypothetical protein HY58_05380 [Flavihumibacter sp. ZG627]
MPSEKSKRVIYVLETYSFDRLNQVREKSEVWVDDYNNNRPHDSLNELAPMVYRKKTNRLQACLERKHSRSGKQACRTKKNYTFKAY